MPPRVVGVGLGSSHSAALLSEHGVDRRNLIGNVTSMMPSFGFAFPGCGVICSWGKGEDGQLGHGTADDESIPKAILALVDHDIKVRRKQDR